jgi:N-ethylmaleimide reductase
LSADLNSGETRSIVTRNPSFQRIPANIKGYDMSILFSKATLGTLTLQNHLVMSPLTRNRATGNLPNPLMAEYYAQRSSVGLIITEGTSPSPNGLGYPRIPGIFSAPQVAG